MILRRIGVALLGLIGGVLAGILVQDLLARLLITAAGDVTVLGLVVLPLLIPVCGVLGAILAVLLAARRSRRACRN